MQGRPPIARPAARGSQLRPTTTKSPLQGRPARKGQPPAAKAPYNGAAGHGQNPLCMGSHQQARSPVGMAGAYGHRQRSRPGRRWRLPTARPQVVAPRPGLPPTRAIVGRSGRQQG
ncbi:hypothetical protein B296_00031401 [Ensete ventricosum]|uniref:Uncharacterized protein n=1 Tax=Ensete ventricosum TaxID=4639 RepID=A0A426XCM3_ENSVE|nr:hypothetical protein B296_00031401 [Ensete ventricosum]